MPRTQCRELYQFSELSDRAKEKAREWYRDGALDYDWWDSVYDDFTTIAEALGFELDTWGKGNKKCIWFSGFCSRGDGACFEGTWRAEDCNLAKLAEYLGDLEQHPDQRLVGIAKGLESFAREHPTYWAKIKHSGRYYHSMSVDYRVEELKETDHGAEDIATAESKEDFSALSRGLMDWLYRSLEKEHDWLLSDEAVDETIEANGYEFDCNGKRIA